jgi:ComF family protein
METDVLMLMAPREHASLVSLLPYRHENVRALIWQLKYKGDRKAVALLADTLSSHLAYEMPGNFVLLPIPLSRRRLHERGYNQVALIGRALEAKQSRFALREDILIRAHHNERQTMLTRLERIRNMRDAFAIADPAALFGKDVLILDDVTTTGATLREAEAAVRACGPRSIRMLALAY